MGENRDGARSLKENKKEREGLAVGHTLERREKQTERKEGGRERGREGGRKGGRTRIYVHVGGALGTFWVSTAAV